VLLAGAADAQSLGVKPGSPDDQSASLSRTLAAAAAKGQPLSLAPGVYKVSRVAVPDGAVLVGMPDVTKLVASGDGPMLYAQKAARIRIYGLTLDAALAKVPERTGVIQIDDVDEAVLSELAIDNAGRNGIVLQRSGGRVDHCRIARAKQAAIWSRDGKGVAITDNHITACANNGILVHRLQRADDGAVISGNRVEDTGAADGGTGPNGNGINVFRADGVIVEGNSVRRSTFSAIRAADSGNVVIAGNQCLKSGETALYVEFAYEGAVVSGNLVDGAGNGISVVNFDHGGRLAAVTGNVVRNLFRRPRPEETEIAYGVGIAVEADAAVTGNVVEEAPTTGLGLGWGKFGRNIAATGNMIRRCEVGIGISVVEGTGIAAISGNVITESRRAAILGFRWKDAVTGDLALGGAEKLPGLSIGTNAVT
jgi:uncharacterized secreted repeat protein (TIGR03808 family)